MRTRTVKDDVKQALVLLAILLGLCISVGLIVGSAAGVAMASMLNWLIP